MTILKKLLEVCQTILPVRGVGSENETSTYHSCTNLSSVWIVMVHKFVAIWSTYNASELKKDVGTTKLSLTSHSNGVIFINHLPSMMQRNFVDSEPTENHSCNLAHAVVQPLIHYTGRVLVQER